MLVAARKGARRSTARRASRLLGAPHLLADYRRHYATARGKYRVFAPAEYRFYRSNVAPPELGDAPYATSSSLPHTPAATFGDGTWYLSATYCNGVIESGFLPLGPRGETYLRLDVAGGVAIGAPPLGPLDWRIEAIAGGVVRVVGVYLDAASNRATQWAIRYTTDGSEPAADTPTITVAMPATGLAVLSRDLPAVAHGTVVRVRLQTRRYDAPTWRYSEGSAVLVATAQAAGPSGPLT